MSGPRSNMQMNGNRRPMNINRVPSIDKPTCAQHEDLIKYIYDSWNKVTQELEKSCGTTTMYYHEENQNLKDFEPFDLQAYWGRRLVQNFQQGQQL